MTAKSPLLPGSWIGIIGGGQLGRMICMEARRMDFRTLILDPDPNCPAGQVSDDRIVAPYSDTNAAMELARRCDVVTYEFENVNAESVEAAQSAGTVYPGSSVLRVAQHRIREKTTLRDNGFPVPNFRAVDTYSELQNAMIDIGLSAVLKTATMGYDGKGQAVLRQSDDARTAYDELRPRTDALVLEAFVPFSKELSVICARDAEGNTACFPVQENIHRDGILDVTIVPARVSEKVKRNAVELVTSITESLQMVGLLAVEMFLTKDDQLLVNELAPRPHNSGHYTLDACVTSQFEQIIRAICGLPLGSTELMTPVVMANLPGDVWIDADGHPDFASTLEVPGVKLHLYGKSEARVGRKMGHICALAPDVETALQRAMEARNRAVGMKITSGD
jgi:5-(carboxyamino)imidazole ribonucleotide synthase